MGKGRENVDLDNMQLDAKESHDEVGEWNQAEARVARMAGDVGQWHTAYAITTGLPDARKPLWR